MLGFVLTTWPQNVKLLRKVLKPRLFMCVRVIPRNNCDPNDLSFLLYDLTGWLHLLT